jgi:hypothetical protein
VGTTVVTVVAAPVFGAVDGLDGRELLEGPGVGLVWLAVDTGVFDNPGSSAGGSTLIDAPSLVAEEASLDVGTAVVGRF